VPLTNDAPKYGTIDVPAKVLAILGQGGYVQSSGEVEEGAPVGLILDKTSFYAGARGLGFRPQGLHSTQGLSWTRPASTRAHCPVRAQALCGGPAAAAAGAERGLVRP
jgi:hypothetical protein